MNGTGPRVALLGFSIECNRFAPPATRADFAARCWVEGEEVISDARGASPKALGEMPGFVADMDAAGPWTPLPVLLAMAEPNGPVAHADFEAMTAIWRRGLEAARGGVDAAYCVLHGAGLTTELDDPEGAVQALVREALGPGVPLVCSHDLHANVSDAMVRGCDAFVGYRTNPHLDMRERGAESARILRRLLAGQETHLAFRRLPIVAPTVSLLTARGPYAEVIDLGQELRAKDGRVLNVSVMGGFAYGDTPFNGMAVVVTATERGPAEALADALAEAAWERRHRFVAHLTPLAEAVRLARESPVPLAFADVADNPGGGGRGAAPCSSWRPSTPRACGTASSASSTTRCWPRRRTGWGWAPASRRASTARRARRRGATPSAARSRPRRRWWRSPAAASPGGAASSPAPRCGSGRARRSGSAASRWWWSPPARSAPTRPSWSTSASTSAGRVRWW